MEKTKVAENKYYTISYSSSKNRVYLKIFGYWPTPESVPDYLDDWKKAIAQVTKGFTLLTDASEMSLHPKEVGKLHEKAQELILKGGVAKVAEVLKSAFAEVQLNSVAATTRFPKKNFRDPEEAERWLDEK